MIMFVRSNRLAAAVLLVAALACTSAPRAAAASLFAGGCAVTGCCVCVKGDTGACALCADGYALNEETRACDCAPGWGSTIDPAVPSDSKAVRSLPVECSTAAGAGGLFSSVQRCKCLKCPSDAQVNTTSAGGPLGSKEATCKVPVTRCVPVTAAAFFTPTSGALYCPNGELNETGCRPLDAGISNILFKAGSYVQQRVRFICKPGISALDFKLKLAEMLTGPDAGQPAAAAILVMTVNGQYIGRTAVTPDFTEPGERGTLWFSGMLPAAVYGEGAGGDEYLVRVELANSIPGGQGALAVLADPETEAETL